MVNAHIEYPEGVRKRTLLVYSELRDRGYDTDIRLGDVYGPNRFAMSIQVNFEESFILASCSTGKWKIAFCRKSDSEAAFGIIYPTDIDDASFFFRWFDDFLQGLAYRDEL